MLRLKNGALSLILPATICLAIGPSAVLGEPALMDGVAVIVNNKVITHSAVEAATAQVFDLLRRQYGRQPQVFEQKLNEARRERLEALVERELILHEFATAGYNLPESLIDDEISRRIRKDFGNRLNLTRTLQDRGMTYEGFRQDVREKFIVDAMRAQNVGAAFIISPQKIDTFYKQNQDSYKVGDQVKLRMISLNKTSEPQPGAHKKLAEEIRVKIKEGASFAEMASIYSTGSQRAQGGDWGWIEKSVLGADLAEIAFALKQGEVSPVTEREDGFYLMLVEETKAAHIRPLAEVREQIEGNLRTQELDRLRKKWMDKLKAKSFVQYY
jgi:parvulin-like peptidyl-prolyl isomerase